MGLLKHFICPVLILIPVLDVVHRASLVRDVASYGYDRLDWELSKWDSLGITAALANLHLSILVAHDLGIITTEHGHFRAKVWLMALISWVVVAVDAYLVLG